jgi:glycosyltransferase involved in cell wall biosynthesis
MGTSLAQPVVNTQTTANCQLFAPMSTTLNAISVMPSVVAADEVPPANVATSPDLGTPMLTIVIPALNEEDAIGSTIQRCLDARERIRQVGRVRDVEIIVVSDGSTDRTAEIATEIAAREPAISVIVFERNRGYGAAIKEGFARGRGELVSFLDADGTCDPNYFGELCQVIQAEHAAVALGSRMQPGNQMPRLRRLGNTLYALLLGSLSGKDVSDTASGMRVLRRDALDALYPLPDGLHFTPAMSARAVMSDQAIVEIPMAYAERVGESKLRVVRDGFRFLFAIRDAVLLYHPSRVFGLLAALAVLTGVILSSHPVELYVRSGRLEEWMIYRLLLCGFLFSTAFTLICSGVLADRVLSLVYRRRQTSFLNALFDRIFHGARLVAIALTAVALAVALVWGGLIEYVTTGHVTIHWSRPLVAVSLLQIAVLAIVYRALEKVVDLWSGQLMYAARTRQ